MNKRISNEAISNEGHVNHDANYSHLLLSRQYVRQTATPKRRVPKSAAVTITSYNSKDFSYSTALKTARERISLQEIRIETAKIRKASNSGLSIEVIDPDGSKKADTLAMKLKDVLSDRHRM